MRFPLEVLIFTQRWRKNTLSWLVWLTENEIISNFLCRDILIRFLLVIDDLIRFFIWFLIKSVFLCSNCFEEWWNHGYFGQILKESQTFTLSKLVKKLKIGEKFLGGIPTRNFFPFKLLNKNEILWIFPESFHFQWLWKGYYTCEVWLKVIVRHLRSD